jgi:hypothetical protein
MLVALLSKKMRYTEEQIKMWLKEYELSGVSKAEFSKNKPFHPATLYTWMSRRNQKSSFVEIRAESNNAGNLEIRRPDGVMISISKSLSISEIIELIKC